LPRTSSAARRTLSWTRDTKPRGVPMLLFPSHPGRVQRRVHPPVPFICLFPSFLTLAFHCTARLASTREVRFRILFTAQKKTCAKAGGGKKHPRTLRCTSADTGPDKQTPSHTPPRCRLISLAFIPSSPSFSQCSRPHACGGEADARSLFRREARYGIFTG